MKSTFSILSLAALPAALAGASLPPVDRNLRHRDLAWKATAGKRHIQTRQASNSSVPLGGFEVVGDSGVSAQMMFLGAQDTVYILDSE